MAVDPKKPVRVRIAPSPTGPFHIGTARTALFNWLFARQHQGAFILRIEDTDKERSKGEHEKDILEGLKWLGLKWDEGPVEEKSRISPPKADPPRAENPKSQKFGPYRQSERTDIYGKYLEQLLAEKKAYYCYCTKEELDAERTAAQKAGLPPKYGGRCRELGATPAGKKPQIIRFRVPETKVEFDDIIRGKVSFDASLFGDIVIARDLANPLYNFAVVVDDALMEISHVIRGEDHLSNTPKQILFAQALGFEIPAYAHLPLILNPDRSKMSKRFSDTALNDYRAKGYLPEAIVNFLALLGWHPQDDRELFTLDDLVRAFDLSRVQKAGAAFNQEKLDWLNREYIKNKSDAEIAAALKASVHEAVSVDEALLMHVISAERSRITTFGDFWNTAGFFFELPQYDKELLFWKKENDRSKTKNILVRCAEIIKDEPEFDRNAPPKTLIDLIEKEGRGNVLWPLRVALSGLAASPDPFEILEVIGTKEAYARIEAAIGKLG